MPTNVIEPVRAVAVIAPAAPCPACNEKIPAGSTVWRVKAQPEAEPVDLHEPCFLSNALMAATQRARIFEHLLAGLVHRSGGRVVLEVAQIQQALAAGGVQSKDEPGGKVAIWVGEEKRIVLAGANEMPPAPRA